MWAFVQNVILIGTNLFIRIINENNEQEMEPVLIHFHETSRTGELNSRQACAVESAARAHPNITVNLMFSDLYVQGIERYKRSKTLAALRQFKNVKVSRISVKKYCKRTPLAALVNSGEIKKSSYVVSHTSDVLRYVSLYKYGGIYLDLDVIVAKSLEPLGKNWVAKEDWTSLNSAVMRVSNDNIGRKVAEAAVLPQSIFRDLKDNFKGSSFINNGPGVITRVMRKICNTQGLHNMTRDACGGFAVYDGHLFYPIHHQQAERYFKPGNIQNTSYVYHFWNMITKHMEVRKDSPYDKLAKEYCKTIYGKFYL